VTDALELELEAEEDVDEDVLSAGGTYPSVTQIVVVYPIVSVSYTKSVTQVTAASLL